MEFILRDYSEDGLPAAASGLLAAFPNERIFAFFASMGAGKTTLIKELCRVLNVEDMVVSPTFSIINEYRVRRADGSVGDCTDNGMVGGEGGSIDGGALVYHFDLYRLKNASEAYDIGFREIILGDSYCFIEWAEILNGTIPSEYVRVEIYVDEKTGLRTLAAQVINDFNPLA
ncbi:MAG: tRNA (adenosine(37)-N6)-threonylcarbamoyltransferase complex ATPase subunit type 1 TsaE [Bacteroidales bacterium]|nr:tRNA (adenosine(37)-N6)-threonylcarbamoyltransferase complex ATPase subunit type 1 TsaE [Bacteroidales bacterium]